VVEGIVAIAWSRVTLTGVQDHAGPTPMRIRHDALVAAADIIRGVREIPRKIGGDMVSTVGRLDVTPNIPNAIPGRVSLSIDLRAPYEHHITRALGLVDRLVKDAAKAEGVTYQLEHYWRVPRTRFALEVVDAIEAAVRSLGCGHRRILSGAGHDAQYMAALCPTGMIFVPSRDGRSHCEEEFTPMDDIEHGANTLLLAASTLAGAP
jgi:N-carbamoyl-L-amino-acid hydrolase